MANKKFTHRPNTPHKLPDGRIIWETRSPAVVAACLFYPRSGPTEVLLVERGPGCPDEVGKSCMPCGYLDFDESGTDGARREVWEEAGVFIDEGYEDWIYKDQPWKVNHYPTSNRQNVSLHFLFSLYEISQPRPQVTFENCEPDEVTRVYWEPVSSAVNMNLAFGHHLTIKELAALREIEL